MKRLETKDIKDGEIVNTRKNLLDFLAENQGKWISGEALSRNLGVSRAAVHKHIRQLKENGYEIASVTGKGYCLENRPDRLTETEIRYHLKTSVFGRNILECRPSLDSTNLLARRLAGENSPEGSLVVTEHQTLGRGRRGRNWFSHENTGICMSLVLRPFFPPSSAFRITLMSAVALTEAIASETGMPVRIKWPNDLLLNGKKTAGILAEITTEMDRVEYIVLGVGINVNTPLSAFPENLKQKAASLFTESGRTFSRVGLLCAGLLKIEEYYEILNKGDFETIRKKWMELSEIEGKRVSVDIMGKRRSGSVKGIDEDGRLLLETGKGQIERFFSGDIYPDSSPED